MATNPFQSGTRKLIPAVLIYLSSGDQVLMIRKVIDGQEEIWNGLGGKLELDESPHQAAARELFEEAGISLPLAKFKMLGTLHLPNFRPSKNEDWLIFVFVATLSPEDNQNPKVQCNEGTLHWVKFSQVAELKLWPGDTYFIPYVQKQCPFAATLWYDHESVPSTVKSHWIVKLESAEESF